MSKVFKPRRGSANQVAAFVGEANEVILNTTTNTLHVLDGLTAGGFPLAKVADLNAFKASQSTKDAAQDAAIQQVASAASSAQSSASSAQSSADAAQSSADAAQSSANALSNGDGFSDVGRDAIVGWGMPDFTAAIDIASTVSLTSTQDRSYPYDCFLYVNVSDAAVSGHSCIVQIDNNYFGVAGYGYNSGTLLIPIRKDKKFKLYYSIGVPDLSCQAIIYPTIGG